MKRMTAAALAALFLLSACAGMAEVTEERTEDRKGRPLEIVWKDESGNLTAGPEGYASVRYTYDGLVTKEAYFDAEGYSFEAAGGYSGRRLEYDTRGKLIMIDYLDAAGNLTLNSLGYARVTMKYFTMIENSPDNEIVYFGTNKKPVIVPSLGYAQVKDEYSGKTQTGRTFMDEKGNPVDSTAGYAMMKKKMNRNHQVIRMSYTHADGTPATGPDGWHKYESDRDNNSRETERRYYDEQGHLTDRGGFARETYSYDREGRITVKRYDPQGGQILFAGTAAAVRRKYKNDLMTEETYLDGEGQPMTLPEGFATVVYSYNAKGQPETIRYRTENGDAAVRDGGYAAIQQSFDGRGLMTRRTFLDATGNKVNCSGGYCEEQYNYDMEGNLREVLRFDTDGNRTDPLE